MCVRAQHHGLKLEVLNLKISVALLILLLVFHLYRTQVKCLWPCHALCTSLLIYQQTAWLIRFSPTDLLCFYSSA